MIVPGDDDVSSVGMQDFEQPPHVRLVAMNSAGTEQRVMPVRQPAVGFVGCQLLDKPPLLRRAPKTAIGIAVERKDMPSAELITLIAAAMNQGHERITAAALWR
jgi:hypothetical protein